MKNKYEIRDEVVAIFLNSPKYGFMEGIISTNKLQIADELQSTWYPAYSKRTKTFYVQGNFTTTNGKRKSVFLHRWITNPPKGMVVDHKNHDTLNCTDSNLRVIQQSENLQNANGSYKNSKSGMRGVSWFKKYEKWRVSVSSNGKAKHIGYYSDLEEARNAAIAARKKYLPYSNEAS